MKPRHQILKRKASLTIVLLGLALSVIPAAAGNKPAPVFDVQASLVTPAKISLGEPIIVRCLIKNVSGQPALAHLSKRGTDWYTLTMTDATRRVVSAARDIRLLHPENTFFSKAANLLQDGTTYENYIAVSKFQMVQHPGQYELTIHVNFPHALTTDATANTPEVWTRTLDQTETQEITLPILVTATSNERLHASAKALLATISDPTNSLGRVGMDALFSMPEAEVSGIWRDLALNPSMNNDLAASELEDLYSDTSVDILVAMLDTPGLHCTDISDRINAMYNNGPPTLRDYIKRVEAKRGIVMPAVAGTPVYLD